METLAKYHVCNHCVIGEKTFKNILFGPGARFSKVPENTGPDKLTGLSRNGPLGTQSVRWSIVIVLFPFFLLLFCIIILHSQRGQPGKAREIFHSSSISPV